MCNNGKKVMQKGEKGDAQKKEEKKVIMQKRKKKGDVQNGETR